MDRALIGALAVVALLAAVFAVLWHGASVENSFLRKQVEDLSKQLEEKSSALQKTTQQLAETQRQLIDAQQKLQDTQRQLQETQKQLQDLNSQLADTKRQLEQAQTQLRDAQTQLQQAKTQLAELERQRALLTDQLAQLNATYQKLRDKIYAGRDLVQQAKTLLNQISLKAPQVGDTWTFTQTYTSTYDGLRSDYFYHLELSLYSYQTVEVWTSERLYLAFFTPEQYERWREGYSATPLASGRGYVKFTPPRDGTYVFVIYNDLGRDVGDFQITYRYSETWHYYDVYPPRPTRPYVVGSPGTPSHDFFRLFAVYNYWLENRQKLAEEVRRQLAASPRTFSLQPQLELNTETLYALSLAALLKDAGFGVSFAAIGTDWEDPFKPSAIIVQVKFRPLLNPNATFNEMFKQVPRGWMRVMWWLSQSLLLGYDFYVVIDTYNVIGAVDRRLDTTTPFNVIYVDGVTRLP